MLQQIYLTLLSPLFWLYYSYVRVESMGCNCALNCRSDTQGGPKMGHFFEYSHL